MHTSIKIGAAIAVVVGGVANGATELVVNGGFETGDFSGWSTVANVWGQPMVWTSVPRTGTYYAQVGLNLPSNRQTSSIAQNIPTTVGVTYHIEFWIDAPDPADYGNGSIAQYPGPNSFFSAEFGGVPILSLLQPDIFALTGGYQYFSATVTALSISSLLNISANMDELSVFPGTFRIDDVSVTALETIPQVPESSTTAALLFLSGATGWSMWRRRSQR